MHILFYRSPVAEASVEDLVAQEEEQLAAVSLFFVSLIYIFLLKNSTVFAFNKSGVTFCLKIALF
jgi:hypothetical protein